MSMATDHSAVQPFDSRASGPASGQGPEQPVVPEVVGRFPLPWGLFLVVGLFWIGIGAYVLALRPGSAGVVLAFIIISLVAVALLEIVQAAAVPSLRWLHGVMAVLLLGGAGYAWYAPETTLMVAGFLLAWALLLMGALHLAQGLSLRGRAGAWWLSIVLGALQIAIGVWALVEPDRTEVLLLVWVGASAVVRGIGDVVLALGIRSGVLDRTAPPASTDR